WSSNLDGALGTGATLNVPKLRSGVHTIVAKATDAGGQSGQAQITITVPNAPVVTITQPADGSAVFQSALPITLTGIATDVEDGVLSGGLQWRSDLDGPLATGASIRVSQLSIGTHVLTASVTDDSGLTGSAQITLRVRGPNGTPQVTIGAPA